MGIQGHRGARLTHRTYVPRAVLVFLLIFATAVAGAIQSHPARGTAGTWTGATAVSWTQIAAAGVPAGRNGASIVVPTNDLELWFKPEALSGLADGAVIATWPDSSGNARDAVQADPAQRPVYRTGRFNGHAVVDFDGAQRLAFSGSKVLSNISLFIVYRYNEPNAPGGTWPFTIGGDLDITGQYWGIESHFSDLTNDQVDIYAGFSNDARATYPGVSAPNVVRVLSAVSAGTIGNTTVKVDGQPAVMSGTGANVALNVPLSGSRSGIGGCCVGQRSNAEIAEILVYSSALGAADRAQVETYLMDKYFAPVPTNDLEFWFNPESLSGLADGAAIATWPDSSGNGRDAVQADPAQRPVYRTGRFNGHAVADFDAAQRLAFSGSEVLSNISLFIVYRYNSATTASYPLTIGGDLDITGQYWGIEAHTTTNDQVDIYAGFSNDARATSPGVSAPNVVRVLSAVSAGTIHNTTVNVDGQPAVMSGTGANVALNVPLSGSRSGIGGCCVGQRTDAEIAEILLYSSALGAADRAQVETYLMDKYFAPAVPSLPNVVINTKDTGPGSLRAAIEFANTTPGPNSILFAIPKETDPGFNGQWFTIRPLSPLPPLMDDGTTIDGTSQTALGNTNPQGPEVFLDGALQSGGHGLEIHSNANVIAGLAIGNFLSRGVAIEMFAGGTGNAIRGNHIGLDPTGIAAAPNQVGISVWNGTNTLIGGPSPSDRNTVSGNSDAGVDLSGGTTGTRIEGNYIGTDATGTVAIGNRRVGVHVGFNPSGAATANTIGGPSPAARNIISGNVEDGIELHGVSGNVVHGNYIGTDVTGSKALGNDLGIEVGTGALSSENQILANVISASNRNGVLIRGDRNIVRGNVIGTDASGTKALGNAGDGVLVGGGSGNLIGGTTAAARNVISGNGGHGMHLTSAGNLVQGNYIGTDAAGRFALGNGGSGVIISASSNTVGGTEPGMGNVISGNGVGTPKKKFGVLAFGASDIKVQGNLIGTDAGGTYAIPNGPSADGVNFFDVTDGLIGGTTGSARNLISGNSGHGISFGGNSRNNAIDGNYIGVDASGMTELPNALAGINFFDVGVTDNAIGGKLSEKRNLISGNGGPGVILGPGSVEGGSNHLIGNYIGTDTLGAAAVPNAGPGVVVRSPGNEIRGNVISGNSANSGIHITTKGNRNGIWGNLIGTNAAGTAAVPNLAGIVIAGAGNDNVIGATEPPGCAPNLRWLCANVIAFNARTGVAMVAFGGTTPERNRVSGNAIFSNGELGIDLNADGVTPNDPGDVDAGPNGLQNFPVLRIAQLTPLGLRVAGSIDTPAPQTILIELFANRVPSPGGDPSGYGEGAEFLGTATPGADGGFSVNLPSVPGGTLISATATDAAGNTSEFAANIAARAPGRP